jgi:predicted AlkP superfamily pyrophosphatase or phosphodiesterase
MVFPSCRLASLQLAALTLWLVACAGATPTGPSDARDGRAGRGRAPLVLLVVIDQLPSEAFLRLRPLLSPRGALRRLETEGRLYERMVYPYATTYTAPGHTMIVSGATPSESGITSNFWIERGTGRPRSSVDDGRHPVLGVPGAHAAPDALRVETVGDVLKATTAGGGRGKVVSLSLKDRAAILSAGKAPDLALWYQAEARTFTTSTYYARRRPAWLERYLRVHPISLEGTTWEPADAAALMQRLGEDGAAGEGSYKGIGTTFPYVLDDSAAAAKTWRMFPHSSEYLLELAFEAAVQSGLGEDDHPDLLVVSVSGTDYAGHVFGPHSWEYADHLRRADLAIARLIDRLEQRSELAVLITSDHGVAPLPEQVADSHPDARRLAAEELTAPVEAAIDAALGPGDWVAGFNAPYLFLTPEALEHPEGRRLRDVAVRALASIPGVLSAHDTARAAALTGSDVAHAQAIQLSLHPDTSGPIYVVTELHSIPDIGVVPSHGTTHGSPFAYDTDVPAWLAGPGIAAGTHGEALDQRRIAPTLAALLGVRPPAAATALPLPGL